MDALTRSCRTSPAPAEPRRAAAGGVRVAVVGCGPWGQNHVRNYAEIGALSALVDPHEERVAALAAEFGGRPATLEAVLADPAIEAIACATPPSQHYALGKEALAAGKHVFVEKPLALKVEEAEELCTLAERLDRRLMVGHILQYHPAFLKLRDLVREGRLGRLQYIYSNRLNLGKIRREEDILWSFAPHDVSMILSLVGTEPVKVEAVGGYFLHRTIADVTTTHLTFPGGEQAHIFVSWLHPYQGTEARRRRLRRDGGVRRRRAMGAKAPALSAQGRVEGQYAGALEGASRCRSRSSRRSRSGSNACTSSIACAPARGRAPMAARGCACSGCWRARAKS